MAIADKLTKLSNDISSAYTTIGTMGGTIPSDKNTDNLSTAISTIPQGSTTTKDFRVRFIDIDGTILKEEWVDSGEDATPPANPTYDSDLLTFAEWNNPYTNVTDDIDIGAIYDTKNDEVVIMKVCFTYATSKEVTIKYLNSDVAGTIDWGDGTTETISVTSGSSATLTHTYTNDYFDTTLIKITGTEGFSFYGNNSEQTFNVFGRNITSLYFGSKYNSGAANNFYYSYLYSLQVLSLNKNATSTFLFIVNNVLKAIILPKNATYTTQLMSNSAKYFITSTTMTNYGVYNQLRGLEECPNTTNIVNLKQYHFQTMSFIKYINLKNVTSLNTNTSQNRNVFTSCINLKELYFEQLTTIPGDRIFLDCVSLENIIINKNSVATLSNAYTFQYQDAAAANSIGARFKIYVPDNLVNTYKTASNWSTYASKIKPISELPTTSHFYPYVKSQINNQGA